MSLLPVMEQLWKLIATVTKVIQVNAKDHRRYSASPGKTPNYGI